MSSLVTQVKLKQIEQLIEKGKRLDEQRLTRLQTDKN